MTLRLFTIARLPLSFLLLLFVASSTLAFLVQPSHLGRASHSVAAQQKQQQTFAFNPSTLTDAFSESVIIHDASSLVAQHQETALSLTAAIGSSFIMLTIVGLLYLWEETIEWLRESLCKDLLPMVESILGEIGGLGFIGLVLQSVLGNNAVKEELEDLSVQFFGEGDILIENFEFLHAAFFQVGVGYFFAAGGMVAKGLKKLVEIEAIEELQFDKQTGTCTVPLDQLATRLVHYDAKQEPGRVTLWGDLTIPREESAARFVLMKQEVMKWFPHLPEETFRVETYLQASFAYNLRKITELSPLTWICLIPALALSNAIDLSHEVINSASPNAAESAGYFFSTFAALVPAVFTVALSTVWGLWNSWKMAQIKSMLLPRVGFDESTGQTEILSPLFESESERKAFDSSLAWVKPIENIWAKPPTNGFDELFGAAGGVGLKLYRNSIKYHTWLCLTHVVFFGTQIVTRDFNAILAGANVGDPEHLMAELVTYGGFVAWTLLLLSFVSTQTFWNFCVVAGADPKNGETLLELSGNPPVPKVSVSPANGTLVTATS